MHSLFEFQTFYLHIQIVFEKIFFWEKNSSMFAFCVKTFEPIKIWTCSAPQNDGLNFSFVKDIKVVVEKMARKRQLGRAGGGGYQ